MKLPINYGISKVCIDTENITWTAAEGVNKILSAFIKNAPFH